MPYLFLAVKGVGFFSLFVHVLFVLVVTFLTVLQLLFGQNLWSPRFTKLLMHIYLRNVRILCFESMHDSVNWPKVSLWKSVRKNRYTGSAGIKCVWYLWSITCFVFLNHRLYKIYFSFDANLDGKYDSADDNCLHFDKLPLWSRKVSEQLPALTFSSLRSTIKWVLIIT